MSRPKKNRIPTQGGQALDNPLGQALSGLSFGALPDVQPTPAPQEPGKKQPLVVTLRRETAHRGGKTVVVLYDFHPQHSAEDLADLAKTIRRTCGAGGAVREETLEIQGDQAAKIREILTAQGYRVKGV